MTYEVQYKFKGAKEWSVEVIEESRYKADCAMASLCERSNLNHAIRLVTYVPKVLAVRSGRGVKIAAENRKPRKPKP